MAVQFHQVGDLEAYRCGFAIVPLCGESTAHGHP
jgi:hypothetical protein